MFDFDQMACDIVSVAEGVGDAPYGFDFLGNPAQFVAASAHSQEVKKTDDIISLSNNIINLYMASLDKISVRTEVSRLKTDFEKL
ncbi:MAG: hypothetical protein NTY50_15775, partial [Methylobacter sp.]|nr:hypothetical protein [Methylobacter sp.]